VTSAQLCMLELCFRSFRRPTFGWWHLMTLLQSTSPAEAGQVAVVGDASSEAGRFLFKGSADFVQHSFASFASPPGRLRNTLTKSTRQLTKPDFVNLIWAPKPRDRRHPCCHGRALSTRTECSWQRS